MHKRQILIALSATAALVGLAACNSPDTSTTPQTGSSVSASVTPSVSASAAPSRTPIPVKTSLDGIKVTGDGFGKLPKVEVPAPYAIDKTQSKVLIQGKGPMVGSTSNVLVYYNGINGSDGKTFQEIYSADGVTGGKPTVMTLASLVKGFQTGLIGQREGSRVLIAMPGPEGYDASGGNPSAGILVGDTLIFVVDIVQTERSVPDAEGKVITPPAGLPTVTASGVGAPKITGLGGTAPTSMTAQTLIEGVGPKVSADAIILTRYVGYSWTTGQVIDDAYGATEADQGDISAAIPGWQTGLVGKTVGSRVLLVLPPKDSFPQGSNNPPVTAGDTVVYVVDILFAVSKADLG